MLISIVRDITLIAIVRELMCCKHPKIGSQMHINFEKN